MPIPDRDRLHEYAVKGLHLAGRQVQQTPEVRAARRLAVQAAPEGDGPVVGFLTPRDWTAHVQWEAMMGHALRQRGARPRFLTCGGGLEVCDRVNVWEGPPLPCKSCTAYVDGALTAHGFPPEPLLGGKFEWYGPDDEWPELDEISVPDLIDVTYDGLALGRITEIPVKWFLMRTDLENEPLAGQTWRAFLRSARRLIKPLERALDRMDPEVVVLLNGLFLFEAVAWAICDRRDIDVVTYERGFIKETLVLDRNRPAGLTELDDFWASRRDVPLTVAEEDQLDRYLEDRRHGRRTIDRYWGDARFETPGHGTEGDGKLVVAFPNLTWDSAVIGREKAFASIQDWLVDAVEHFAGRPQDTLVIRLHPAETKLPGKQTREPLGRVLSRRVPDLPDNVVVIDPEDPISSYPLMEAADLGLVYTSTTGLELALAGTPVVVAGETHYAEKGFTIDVDDPEGFRAAVDEALDADVPPVPDSDLARGYAHLFFFEAPVASPGVEEHVPGLARITIENLSDLGPDANIAVDRICDTILGSRVPSVEA